MPLGKLLRRRVHIAVAHARFDVKVDFQCHTCPTGLSCWGWYPQFPGWGGTDWRWFCCRYSLPHLAFDKTYVLRCRPQLMALNSNSVRMSIIDINGVLTFFDMEVRWSCGCA